MKINLLSIPALVLIFIMWITPGLVGREPWKADEPYSFGLVNHVIQTRDWVVPELTGEPFLEKPPLFYVTAAWFGRIFSPPLELYDAARLASAFYMLLALLFFAMASRELYGEEHGGLAVILLIGCVHLQVNAHKLITDVALFTGFAVAFYGFALCSRRPNVGGFWIGTGTGIGFLAKGILAPGMLGMIALALPVLFPPWRRKDYRASLAVAFAAALPWLVIWPAALYARSPEFFLDWLWYENFGRFLGFASAKTGGFNVGSPDPHSWYLRNLLLIGWPVVLPACWALWHFRRSWRVHPLFQVPLVSFLVILAVLSASTTNRGLYAMPMLLPLTLLAIPGIERLPARTKLMASRASVFFFGLVALLVWLGWLSLMTGRPGVLAQKLHTFQPDYVPSVNAVLLAAAVLYSLAWLFLVIKVTRSPDHAAVNWTLGVVLVWGLAMTLWLPALNEGSSYRAAFTSLKKSMPNEYSCLASVGLGESERAMLEYYDHLQTRRMEAFGLGDCDTLLEQRPGNALFSLVPPGWKKIWEFKHPSIRPKDIFALYKKGG
jgi:4-amino-4-deoxy-L-arabinose transferase-like glycosyltransferase